MVRKLQGFTAMRQVNVGQGILVYAFSRPSGDIYVLWAGKETAVKLPVGAERVTVTSIAGASVEGKSESLSVTTSPVFVEPLK